jgi:membrane protease YdiL (CAAX protease family)
MRLIDFAALLVATWIAARVIRTRLPLPRLLPASGALRLVAAGAAWGLAAMTVIIGALWVAGSYTAGPLLRPRAWWNGSLWLIAMFAIALFEEYQYRGLVRALLSAVTPGFWPAALLTSSWFALMHLGNSGETPAGIAGVFAMGIVLSALVHRTGSLWAAIGFHWAWNWAESFLFGVADGGGFARGRLFAPILQGPTILTGGSAGPEGSLVALVVCGLLTLILLLGRAPLLEEDGNDARSAGATSTAPPDYATP